MRGLAARLVLACVLIVSLAAGATTSRGPASTAATTPSNHEAPAVVAAPPLLAGGSQGEHGRGAEKSSGHVFIIVLENEGYDKTFGSAAPSPELAKNLTAKGRLLTNYYGTGHASLDNYISMVSGQAPNLLTQGDCAYYVDFTMARMSTDGQAVGQGCVYPTQVQTIGDQLDARGLAWKQYAEDMASGGAGVPKTCRHQPIGSEDTWQGTSATDQYATRHVPFVYFHHIIDRQTYCDEHAVDLEQLVIDLQHTSTTPHYVFITPDVCSDGHDADCAGGGPGGYQGIEQFLRNWTPRILGSPAYQHDGTLLIVFDESDIGGQTGADACCNEPAGYNTPMPGIYGPGGGRTGAVLLSPCIAPGSTDTTPYNHYGLLRGVEDHFGLTHLGYAAQDGLQPLVVGSCNH